MAPGRKRGAKKDKDQSGLSLGDLVLAKVKGFPFWPAKISKPEDWQQPPDPKKYFVEFFGTKEIGFVAPVDIQAFTSESKTKLLSRCRRQSKLPKYFKEATEEISEAFEELEQKNSTGLRQDTEGSTIRCSKESNVDGINHDTNKDEISTVGVNGVTESFDSGLGLGSCSNKLGETDSLDIKPSTSCHASDGLTMELTAGGNHKVSDGAQAKREASLTSTQNNPSHQKENISSDKDDDDICMNRSKVMTARKGLNSRPKNRISDSEDDSSSDTGDGKKDGSASARVPHHAKKAGGGQNALVNGQKSKKTIIGSKRRREVSNSDVTSLKDGITDRCDVPESGGHLKEGMKRKIASGDGTKNLSPDASRRVKDQLKNKKRSNTADDVQNIASSMVQAKGQHSGREKNVQLVKRNVGTNEIAHPAKKLKRVDSGDDATKRLHPESVKTVHPSSNVVEDKSAKHSNIKRSASRVKAENHLASRTQTEMVELKVHDDETVLPLLKRHRREPEAMRDSPIPISDDKTEKNSPVLKTDVPSSNRGLGIQSHKKRRAVRLYDNDEDDEISKTPIHGGSARNVAPSAALDTVKVAESKQENYQDHPQSIREDNALEDKLPKELSSGIRKESLPSSQPQAFEKKPKQENYQDHPQSIGDDSALEDKLPKEPSSGIRKQSLPSSQSQALEKKPKQENYQDPPQSIRDDCALEDKLPKEPSSGIRKESLPSSQPLALEKKPKKVTAAHISVSPAKFESNQSKVAKPVITSPPLKPAVEQQKVMKPAAKVYSSSTPKKAQSGFGKGSDTVFENINSSHNQVLLQRNKSASSIERSKTLPKSNSRMNGNTALAEVSVENSFLSGERQEVDREDKAISLLDSRISDSTLSMKDLIAVAQAKRKQTHSQNNSLANSNSAFISGTDPHGGSSSPSSALQPFLTGTDSVLQTDMHGSYNHITLGTPLAHGQQSSSRNQIDYEEVEERRGSSGHRGSLSGGTEAAVARDAFEGMIETLSRTKESIGRATRLAIDCVKYGIANEVVDLLIRKLETEPSSHRKVDLFFLVDSITQCSHNQKGIAGASYIPAVQAALPRLLGAAAPPGAGARENRRQCLKVLRLWLERKILPESLLRRYMDDIGGSNDDTSAGFFLKRPSRAERAVDDPIREMEGMLVDEYGSNATFQLPGFLSCHVFDDEEEEDLPSISCKETGDATLVESAHALGESETYTVTPNDRRHCILEDVDGELEMEDASGHLKEDRPLSTLGFDINLQQKGSDKILESGSTSSSHLPPFLEGSPPLPLDSPPPPPPLPSSPPPPPPPLSPSPPPPPPPSLPPPAPPSGPPPSLPLPPVMPSGHPPSMVPQPPGATQSLLPPQSAVQSSPQLAYLTPVPQEYCSTPSGNQVVQIDGNTPHGSHLDVSVKGELFQQQSPCFVQPASHGSRDPSGFSSSRQLEYGNTDLYMTPQVSQPNQQFQSGNAPFGQRPSHPALSQPSSSQFSYSKPTVQQLNQHSYSRPYSLTSHSDGRHRYVTDEQWRMPTSELIADNQRGVWMSSGRTHSSSGPSFVQEGYFRPHPERPPSNNTSFQHSVANNPPAGTPIQGHGVPQILPHRTDMSALNCWRPS